MEEGIDDILQGINDVIDDLDLGTFNIHGKYGVNLIIPGDMAAPHFPFPFLSLPCETASWRSRTVLGAPRRHRALNGSV